MTDEDTEATKLCLVIEAGASASACLAAAIEAVDISVVILSGTPAQPLTAEAALPLIEIGQSRDVTVLIADDARLARTLRADGVHLSPSDAIQPDYETAREIVGTRFVVGAHAGKSRHDAMSLGEADADYIAFGAPAFVKDRDAALQRRYDMVSWWAEIFQIPCMAMDVATPEQADELASAGADFIAVPISPATAISEQIDNLKAIAAAVAIQK